MLSNSPASAFIVVLSNMTVSVPFFSTCDFPARTFSRRAEQVEKQRENVLSPIRVVQHGFRGIIMDGRCADWDRKFEVGGSSLRFQNWCFCICQKVRYTMRFYPYRSISPWRHSYTLWYYCVRASVPGFEILSSGRENSELWHQAWKQHTSGILVFGL